MPDFNPFSPLPTGGPSPQNAQNDLSVWQEGLHASCYKDATWPDRCVICNAPAEGYTLKLQLQWHPRWVYLLIIPGVLWYLIAMLITRKTAIVHVGLCVAHQQRRKIGIATLIGSFFLLLAGMGLGISADEPLLLIFGLIGFFVALIAGALMMRVVNPIRIDNERIWAKVGQQFLESLPTNY